MLDSIVQTDTSSSSTMPKRRKPTARKLTAIVALDVANYSQRTEYDEDRATAEVAALRSQIVRAARRRRGRVFNTAGDGFMLEFASSRAAVEVASELAQQCEPKVRVGVHLGDVVVEPNGDLLGHGVNVAARLMTRSDPGSVLVSADVHRTIRGPLAERLVSRGRLRLDKMSEEIEVFTLPAYGAAVVGAHSRSGDPVLAVSTLHTSVPHNLPSLQPFFGREEELGRIADALDPRSRTWGALIDGPGGMGKTSLAVRAAYDAPANAFEKTVFVSLKFRELDDDGERDLSGFLISGLAELFNKLARELGRADIAKAPSEQRPRLLLEALSGKRVLLVLDNLESLLKPERDVVFTFVKKLPPGCKAILTSRGRIGSGAEELILEELSEPAALSTLAKLAEHNTALAKTSDAERRVLYRETTGKPLLLRWTAGQIGRGSCLTVIDAIAYLRSCPQGNDPLEFIFGDLVEDFSESESRVLCALTYFTLPARVEQIAELAACVEGDTDRALRSLINRSLVVPSEELKTFAIIPLVADFLRKKRPEVVAVTGDRLEERAYALVVENGHEKYDRFAVLEAGWPMITAALPRFLGGASNRLQTVCNALQVFLNFSGRWDEALALSSGAERHAVTVGDLSIAGWRAYYAGSILFLRAQTREVHDCADRAENYWREHGGAPEQCAVNELRGHVHRLAKDYPAAIEAYRRAVAIGRSSGGGGPFPAALNSLAMAEEESGDLATAEHDYREALETFRVADRREGVAVVTSNLARLALGREDWARAERLARDALRLAEELGRVELIAEACHTLANSLMRQDKKADAVPHARRALEIYTRLGSPYRAPARKTLDECERS